MKRSHSIKLNGTDIAYYRLATEIVKSAVMVCARSKYIATILTTPKYKLKPKAQKDRDKIFGWEEYTGLTRQDTIDYWMEVCEEYYKILYSENIGKLSAVPPEVLTKFANDKSKELLKGEIKINRLNEEVKRYAKHRHQRYRATKNIKRVSD